MDDWATYYPDLPDEPYDFISSDFVYSRWKERHLVPDHRQNVLGACYAGFYCTSFTKPPSYNRCIISKEHRVDSRVVLSQELRTVFPSELEF